MTDEHDCESSGVVDAIQPQHILRIITQTGQLSRRARALIKTAPPNIIVEVVDIRTCTEPESFVILDELDSVAEPLRAIKRS